MDKKEVRRSTRSNKSKKSQTLEDNGWISKLKLDYLSKRQYKLTQVIGKGGYGVVYKVIYRVGDKDKQFAMKINFNTVSQEVIFTQVAYLILAKISRNLPKMTDIFNENNFTHIVMEYFQYKPFITFFKEFDMVDTKHYMIELLIGLKSLKNLGIYHRDLKPGNFLYNPQTKKGMIVDFGLAEVDIKKVQALQEMRNKLIKEKEDISAISFIIKLYKNVISMIKLIGKNKIGTQVYMPLQSILKTPHQSYEVQIWSAGVIFLQLLIKKFTIFSDFKIPNKPQNIKNTFMVNFIFELANLFGRKQVIKQCRQFGYDVKLPSDIPHCQIRSLINIPDYDDAADDLLNGMLNINPKTRITVEKALQHRFFDSIRAQHGL